MSTFLIILRTLAVFVYVANPLRKQHRLAAGALEDDRLDELQMRRDTTYAMLKELEFDHDSGLLADEDFVDLEDRYKGKAISILKNLDSVEKGTDPADEIEQEVLRLRRLAGGIGESSAPATRDGLQATDGDEIERQVLKLRRVAGQAGGGPTPTTGDGPQATGEDEMERQVNALRQGTGRFCTQCGTRTDLKHRFCANCGASLIRGGK